MSASAAELEKQLLYLYALGKGLAHHVTFPVQNAARAAYLYYATTSNHRPPDPEPSVLQLHYLLRVDYDMCVYELT